MSWEKLKLGDIFEIARGGSPRPIETFLTNDKKGVNWIMIGDTKDGGKYIEKTAKKIKREGVSNSRMVKEGDFLLTNSMSFGRPYILKTSGCIHDGWLVLSPKDENISRDYFYYYLGSDEIKQRLSSKAAGAVVKNLNKEIVSDLEIELPPLATQKRIAEILDAADALRRKDQELLKKYDELAQAIFIDMFGDPVKNEKGWEVNTIKSTTDIITYGLTVRPNYIENGIPLISARELKNGFVDYKSAPKIAQSDFNKLSNKCKPQEGDILFSKTGSIGLSAIVEGSQEFAVTQNAARIRFKSEIYVTNFIYSLLRQESFINKCTSLVKGNAVKDLQLGDFSEIEIICPPIDRQVQFSELCLNSNQLIKNSKENSKVSDYLFNSLIQKAFKGELVA